jgi:hypothetical protein
MTRSRTFCWLLTAGALLAATPALAQTASKPPTSVSGVVVAAPAKEPPKVVATFPEAGKSVAPGALILKVTFDQKMNSLGWDYAKGQDRYPQCLDRPRLLPDEKTFVLLCTAGGNGHFSVTFNATEGGGFENLAGQRATPAALDFTTNGGDSLATIEDAMKAAGLKSDEGPVMDSKPAPALASVGGAAGH